MDNNKPQLIDLWRTSFDDSEEFIKLFFDRVYKKENALFIKKDGKIVSALQMLPYVMTYYGTEISVNYIYAACTLPSERGQGLMRQLIQDAFKVMESRKVALTVIIPADPWLFDYYRDLGYTEAFDYSEETYIRPFETAWEQGVLVVPPEAGKSGRYFRPPRRLLKMHLLMQLYFPFPSGFHLKLQFSYSQTLPPCLNIYQYSAPYFRSSQKGLSH